MLSTIAISGYRSLREIVVPLHGLDIVTGANGSGKSSLYRSLRLLAETSRGGVVAALAREGGLESTLWAGPQHISAAVRRGERPVQGTLRTVPIGLRLGFGGDDFGYLIDLGLPGGVSGKSMFDRDPEIKREVIWNGPVLRPSTTLVQRGGPFVQARDDNGEWLELSRALRGYDSMLSELADPGRVPEIMTVRERVRSWRFYDSFRTDPDAPVRQAQIGTRTPVLAHDGSDLAAALQTVAEIGDGAALDQTVADAFPGSSLQIGVADGRFELRLRQPGMLRSLTSTELSDGTLRYLLLVAALLTARPPELMVLNEPETSLHPELLPALGRLIVASAEQTQLIVVSHSQRLIDAIRAESERAHVTELEKDHGQTQVVGLGRLEQPSWHWGNR